MSFIKSLEYEAYADGEASLSSVVGVDDKNYLMIENRDFIESCMERLTEDERRFIKCRYYEEKSQKDIARIMGVSQMQISRMEKTVLRKIKNMYFRD